MYHYNFLLNAYGPMFIRFKTYLFSNKYFTINFRGDRSKISKYSTYDSIHYNVASVYLAMVKYIVMDGVGYNFPQLSRI